MVTIQTNRKVSSVELLQQWSYIFLPNNKLQNKYVGIEAILLLCSDWHSYAMPSDLEQGEYYKANGHRYLFRY